MRHYSLPLLSLALALAATGCGGSGVSNTTHVPEADMTKNADDELAPPVAPRRPHEIESPHGTRVDPYFWLRDDSREDPDVLSYLRAENEYTAAMLAPTEELQETLYREIVGRIKEDDSTAPVLDDGYWYYVRFEKGKQYPIHARKKGSLDADEEILLDGNALAEGHDFYRIGSKRVSPDGTLLAYTEDTVGRRRFTLRFKNLETGETYPDRIESVTPAIEWAADDRTVLYVAKDPVTLRGHRVAAHVLGEDPASDRRLYQEDDETFYTTISKSRSDEYLFIVSWSTLTTEVHYARADDPALSFEPVVPRERGHEYEVGHRGDSFVMLTNDEARNFRIVEAPIGKTADRDSWREIVPHREDVFLEDVEVFRDFMAIEQRSEGLCKVRIRTWEDGEERLIDADEPAYTMEIGATPEFDSRTVRYRYTSMTTPDTLYDHDVESGDRTLVKREEVLGDFDRDDYVTEYLHAPARDGASVPISLVYHRDTPIDGTAPLLVTGYGSYGASRDPGFSSPRLSLLDRGFVVAIAHVRGGQEKGRRWYEDGRQLQKKNTFHDFIDATELLVEKGYGAKDRVAAAGGSAGGLLVGAVVNMRPDLYRAVIARVPFVDIVTTMLDEDIPLTTGEFDEWGNPKEEAFYDYMLSYSPYDNVTDQAYPALLVTTGLWDSQVQYWEPAKWVAKLRAHHTGAAPILLHTDMEAGHGGKSGRYDKYREVARNYAFLIEDLPVGSNR